MTVVWAHLAFHLLNDVNDHELICNDWNIENDGGDSHDDDDDDDDENSITPCVPSPQ